MRGARGRTRAVHPAANLQKRHTTLRFCKVAGIAAVALGCLIAAASATAYDRVTTASIRAQVDGYRFQAGTRIGVGTNPGWVSFFQEDEEEEVATGAVYRVAEAGSYANRRMDLDFGPFGIVRARFVQEDERRTVRHHGEHCAEVEIVRIGRFEGRIDVEGENGFAAVNRSTIHGRVESYRIRGCARDRGRLRAAAGGESAPPVPRRLLRMRSIRHPAVTACGADRDTWFFAGRGFGQTAYGASFETRGGGVHALRLAFSAGRAGELELDPDVRRARIEPAADYFTGTARYRDNRLRGDIAADFPGRSGVALAPARARLGDVDDIGPGPCYPFTGD